jgi:hypothetical protein
VITNEQLDELESLAKRASGGDWVLVTEDEYTHIECENGDDNLVSCVSAWWDCQQEIRDIEFIAAANPKTILGMIEEIRRLRETN